MTGLLGSFCIFCGCCVGLGLQMRERRRRRNTLEQLEHALWRMAQEIRMTRTPMPSLLKQLGKSCRGEAGRFFERVAEEFTFFFAVDCFAAKLIPRFYTYS